MGNGRVFALVGLDAPVNTLTNAVGPRYQRPDGGQGPAGFLGDLRVEVLVDGVVQAPVDAAVQQVRGPAVVRTWEDLGGLDLSTTTWAPPGAPTLLRHVALSGSVAGEVALRWTLARAEGEAAPADARGLAQLHGDRAALLSCPGGAVVDDALVVPVDLGAGAWAATCALAFAEAPGGWDPAAFQGEADPTGAVDPVASLEALRAAVEAEQPATLDSGSRALDDLVEGALRTVRVQTDPSGVVSPMSRYTSGWLRDAEGPVHLLSLLGLHERARAVLDGTVAGLAGKGALANSFSLDEFDPDALPADPASYWATVPFMPGRAAAEAPSYPVLHEALVARWTGAPIPEDRLALLRACLDRQERSDEGLLPFSGDETYRYPMAFVLGDEPEALGWSLGSSLLWAAAARALDPWDPGGGWAARAEEVVATVEAHYWVEDGGFYAPLVTDDALEPWPAPYEDLAWLPAWLGDTGLDPDRLATHLATVAARLDTGGVPRSDGAIGFTGMLPGFVIAATGEVGLAVAADPGTATPSGHFEEIMASEGLALQLVHQPDGTGSDVTARYRPWETGVVAASVLRATTGAAPGLPEDGAATLRLAPVPPGGPRWRWEGLRLGEGRATLAVDSYDEGVVVELVRDEAGGPWLVDLALPPRAGATYEAVWVDGQPAVATPPTRPLLEGLWVEPGQAVQVVASISGGAALTRGRRPRRRRRPPRRPAAARRARTPARTP